jgi:hypothetical protein
VVSAEQRSQHRVIVAIADYALRDLPNSSTELDVRSSNYRYSTEPSDRALEIRAQLEEILQEAWTQYLTKLTSRFDTFEFGYVDVLDPQFQPKQKQLNRMLSISKPSERSMWVDPVFTGRDFRIVEDLCFVLMPFSAELLGFYDNAVKSAVESLGLICKRADDIKSGQSDIMENIWSALNQTKLVIAALTSENASVCYELEIANTLGKRVIAIYRQPSTNTNVSLPFDVRARRTLFYEDSAAGAQRFQRELQAHIETILSSGT